MTGGFSILPTVTGEYEVIDDATGRAVDSRPSARAANGVAQHLSTIAKYGNADSMAVALGCAPPSRVGAHA